MNISHFEIINGKPLSSNDECKNDEKFQK